MDNPNQETQSIHYVIRVKNHLESPHWETWFDGMTITNTKSGETILAGYVPDQCALHGLLEKIRNLNLTLISVQQIDPE